MRQRRRPGSADADSRRPGRARVDAAASEPCEAAYRFTIAYLLATRTGAASSAGGLGPGLVLRRVSATVRSVICGGRS